MRLLMYLLALPARRLFRYVSDLRSGSQLCKRCGRAQNEVGFTVSDETWSVVVPARWQRWALCLACFEALARRRGFHTLKVFLVHS